MAEPIRKTGHSPFTTLLIGATGQLGFELCRVLSESGDVIAPPRSELDLSRPQTIPAVMRALRPNVVVNAAAYTAVDRAESERALCFAVNADAPGVLAEEALRLGSGLIHYSTDYVFDGQKTTPYEESDAAAPLNVYGESKLAGERAVESVGGSWVILRTSWVYGRRGANFLTRILQIARERDDMRVVDDQIGAPTWSRSIAAATGQILAPAHRGGNVSEGLGHCSGVYHMTAAGTTSWFGFAEAILKLDPHRAAHRVRTLIPIASSEFVAAAARPRWSVMNGTKLHDRFGIRLPSWKSDLALALGDVTT